MSMILWRLARHPTGWGVIQCLYPDFGHPEGIGAKPWFTIRDAYGVAIAPDQDAVLLLAAAVKIDELSDPDHDR